MAGYWTKTRIASALFLPVWFVGGYLYIGDKMFLFAAVVIGSVLGTFLLFLLVKYLIGVLKG